MMVFTLNQKRLNSTQIIFYQVLFMLPVIVFYVQAIFQIGNEYSIPILKLYQTVWISSLTFSLYLGYKTIKSEQTTNIKMISACLGMISLYFLLINLKISVYLLRDLFEFLADFFGFIGDLISGKVH